MIDKRLKILITNDDGIFAPGIRSLYEGLQDIAEVVIVAPAIEQSGMGLAISARSPLVVEKVHWAEGVDAYSVTGTPADCVKMALHTVLETAPDFVVSGINRGSNAGRNVLYSGTVGGAIEAALRKIPSMALSCVDFVQPDYETAKKHVAALVQYLQKHPLPAGTLLNVNFPATRGEAMKGLRLGRQGRSYYKENPDKRLHPDGKHYYWLGGQQAEFDDEPNDSDISILRAGYGAAVPIYIDELTHHSELQNRVDHFTQLFGSI